MGNDSALLTQEFSIVPPPLVSHITESDFLPSTLISFFSSSRRLTYEGADSISYSDVERAMHGKGELQTWDCKTLTPHMQLLSDTVEPW